MEQTRKKAKDCQNAPKTPHKFLFQGSPNFCSHSQHFFDNLCETFAANWSDSRDSLNFPLKIEQMQQK